MEIPLINYVVYIGLSCPVFAEPSLSLAEHLDKFKPHQVYKNIEPEECDIQSILVGVANGLQKLHDVMNHVIIRLLF